MQLLENHAQLIDDIITKQNEFFSSGKTMSRNFRKEALKRLKSSLLEKKDEILDALYQDLGNDRLIGFVKDVGVTIKEIDYIQKHLKKWMKGESRFAGMLSFPAIRARTIPMPRGRTVIISPWNYPILLTFVPLAYSIAAGNTTIVKPSEISVQSSRIINEVIQESFDSAHVACIEGGKEIGSELIKRKHGLIYFIGGEKVGRIIAEAAAKTLTPTVLELGGKSPAIVADDRNLSVTAKRIILGKWINAGQTCVAPDYILVDRKVKDKFMQTMIKELKRMGLDNLENYSKIVNERHFERILSLMDGVKDKIVYGGNSDKDNRKIQLTIIENPPLNHQIMQEEIFGPILPVIEYGNEEELVSIIGRNPTPLALYVFSKDNKFINSIHSKIQFGNGCINDTLFQFGVTGLPIGGVGTSGYGYNKGKASFDEFSRMVSILKKPRWLDTPFFYPPHGKLSKLLTEIIFRTKL